MRARACVCMCASGLAYAALRGENCILMHNYYCIIAKARDKMTKDFTKNNKIKDELRVGLRDLVRIMGRWKGYFDKLLHEENHRSVSEDGVPNDGLAQGISRK